MNLNKIIMLLLVTLLISIGSAGAATSSGGQLSLAGLDEDGTAIPLVIGLSPKVSMIENTNGTSIVDSQWFSIGSGHPGGNRCYGSAQDVNNIYYQEYDTASELSDYFASIPTDQDQSGEWADWSQ